VVSGAGRCAGGMASRGGMALRKATNLRCWLKKSPPTAMHAGAVARGSYAFSCWAPAGAGALECGGWARALRQGQSLRAATSLPRQRGLASAAAPAVQRSITMIKKLTPDGEQCRKCNDIEARLERDGLLDQVDTHIYMDLDDPNDPGTKLATKHDVKVAPFFVVQNLDEKREVIDEEVYTVYLKMKKQVFDVAASKDEEAADVALSIF
jgi:hypothetical protein